MERLTISCLMCDKGWSVPSPLSIYEQQAQESCPCPFCGCYTLCCVEQEGRPGRREAAVSR